MSEPLLTIANHHSPSCGDPPIIAGTDQNLYLGYFENEHGEQWIFVRDRATGIALLRGGDIGWNTALDVSEGPSPDLMLNRSESNWLSACLAASSPRRSLMEDG